METPIVDESDVVAGMALWLQGGGVSAIAAAVADLLDARARKATWELRIVPKKTGLLSPGAGWEPCGGTSMGDFMWRRRLT